MVEQRYFEDLDIGETFECPSQTVTETHFQFFAGITGDFHPTHLDADHAAGGEFGGRVTHGALLSSFAVLGASTLAPHVRETVGPFLEQSARFLHPVGIGDTIRPELEVAGKEDKGERGIVTFASRIRTAGGEVAMEGEVKYMIECREG